MKTVCIGDSIVKGYPFEAEASWVSILQAEFAGDRTEDGNYGHQYVNCGENGETSRELCHRFPQAVKGAGGVILSTGTNDFIFTEAEPQEVFENIRGMAEQAMEAGAQVTVIVPILTIPELACRCWAEGTDYLRVNRCLKRLGDLLIDWGAKVPGAAVVNLQEQYNRWCSGGPMGKNQKLAYVDGIHPTREGYQQMAAIIGRELHGAADGEENTGRTTGPEQ